MAKRGLVRTIFKRLGIILINAFETIGGLLKLFDLTLRQFAWLLFVTGLGLLLLWARETFFDIAPSIASQVDAWTVGINTLIVAVDAMMITIEAITSILASIISGQPQFDAIPTVSAEGVQEFCETVPPACAPINSAALVLDILIRPAASPAVCPTVRYMYPTWVYDIFWPVVDAFALSYEATPSPGNNCQCNEHCTHQIACVVLGSGYLVLEILLPLLLIGLLAGSILPPLLRIVWSVLLMGLAVIYRVVDYLADDILEPLIKAIFTRD